MNPRRGAAAVWAVHHLSPLFVVAIAWLAAADIPTTLRIGPLSLSGLATLVSGAAAVLLSPALLLRGRSRSTPRSWRFAIAPGPRRGVVPLPLILFCAYAVVGLVWDPSANGLQQVAVYCGFAGAIAVGALYSDATSANRFLHVLGIVMGLVGIATVPVFLAGVTQLWGERSFALTGIVAIAVLVPYRSGSLLVRLSPYALAIGIAASLSRTALAIAVLLIAFAILRSRNGFRGIRIVLALGGLALAGVAAFLAIPSLRDRFTQGDNGVDIGGVALNTSGRSQIWALVIKDALRAPWFGQGAGTASDAVTARYPFIAQPHNDYLRLWHDFGLLGLALFVLAVLERSIALAVSAAVVTAVALAASLYNIENLWYELFGLSVPTGLAAATNDLALSATLLLCAAVVAVVDRARTRPAAAAA